MAQVGSQLRLLLAGLLSLGASACGLGGPTSDFPNHGGGGSWAGEDRSPVTNGGGPTGGPDGGVSVPGYESPGSADQGGESPAFDAGTPLPPTSGERPCDAGADAACDAHSPCDDPGDAGGEAGATTLAAEAGVAVWDGCSSDETQLRDR